MSKSAGSTRANTQQLRVEHKELGAAKVTKALTRKNLAQFNKMARKKGTNNTPVSASPECTDGTGSTKTTSTTTSGFAIKACKNGILAPSISKAPTNHKARLERDAESRGTASPTKSEYGDFVDRIGAAFNESTTVVEVTTEMLKKHKGMGYYRAFNKAFTAFPKDVGFNNGLSVPQPDFAEGTQMRDYLPFPVDEHVSGSLLYTDNPRSVTLPHLAGEWKGPGKDMNKATLQSGYDGAALVYARNQALSYLGKSDPPGHAEVATFTTDGKALNFYSHYSARTEDQTLEYHQYPEASYNLMNFDGYKAGRRHLRNEQDHAKKQSYDLRDQLKEHWKRHRDDIHPTVNGASLPIPDGTSWATNVDEDEAGNEMVKLPTPLTSSQPPMG